VSEESWICPFCNHAAIVRAGDKWNTTGHFVHPLTPKTGYGYYFRTVFCPNQSCKKTQIKLALFTTNVKSDGKHDTFKLLREWSLLPESAAKPFPEYIPAAILADYNEACLTATLSPKASATLARRCLQGMIRDFWGISKRRLKDEIDALEGKVDSETWDAIDAVRKIGNIGAHMDADINVIVDVDPHEADLLIGLIETLLAEWYIGRYQREQRMAKIKAAAEAKEQPPKPTS
jgi:hypothetical protein